MSLFVAYMPYIQIGLSVLLVTAILMQRSEAGLGSGIGGGSNPMNSFYSKRGAEKNLFVVTIILGILFFIVSILGAYFR